MILIVMQHCCIKVKFSSSFQIVSAVDCCLKRFLKSGKKCLDPNLKNEIINIEGKQVIHSSF